MGLWWSLVVGWWGMETPMKSPMFAGQIPWNPHNPARPGTSRHFLPWCLTSPAAETQLGSMATGFSRSASSISASTETQHGAPGGEQGALEAFLKSRLGMMGMMGINQKMKCWIVLALHLSLQRIWKKERNLTLLVQKSESLTVLCWDFSGLHSKSWMQEHLFPLQTRHWVRHTFTTCLRFGCLTVSTQKAHDPAFASASCVHVCLHLHKHRIASCLEAYTLTFQHATSGLQSSEVPLFNFCTQEPTLRCHMRGVLLGGEHASDAAGDLLQVQVPQAAIGYQNPIGKRVVHLEIGHSDWEE